MAVLNAHEAVPQLTTVRKNDGFQFELMLAVPESDRPITKVRIGPYNFKKQHLPKLVLGGPIVSGGPENCFAMHVSSPPGWSRVRWEIDDTRPEHPVYLTWTGMLAPGTIGVFRFISIYSPGGLRAGLELFRGADVAHFGVTGPNYEDFETGHGHDR